MKIGILSESARLAADENVGVVARMANACDLQVLNDAGPVWGRYATVTYYPSVDQVPSDVDVQITIFDHPDQVGALGFHDEQAGMIFGHVFVDPVLENGGTLLSGLLSVSSVLSHEVLETLVDPYVNGWWARPDGSLVAAELCDPVESDSYSIPVLGQPVMVSNFITPRWSDPQAPARQKFDFLGNVHEPFGMTPGGYLVVQDAGNISQVFGARVPAWRKDAARRRLARRIKRTS